MTERLGHLQHYPTKRMFKQFSIRTLMWLTLAAALLIVGLTRFNPYFDDSNFVRQCIDHKGRTFGEFIEFCNKRNRVVVETFDLDANVIGLSAHGRDGQLVYLLFDERRKPVPMTNGTTDWDSISVEAVETYRILDENSAGMTLELVEYE